MRAEIGPNLTKNGLITKLYRDNSSNVHFSPSQRCISSSQSHTRAFFLRVDALAWVAFCSTGAHLLMNRTSRMQTAQNINAGSNFCVLQLPYLCWPQLCDQMELLTIKYRYSKITYAYLMHIINYASTVRYNFL